MYDDWKQSHFTGRPSVLGGIGWIYFTPVDASHIRITINHLRTCCLFSSMEIQLGGFCVFLHTLSYVASFTFPKMLRDISKSTSPTLLHPSPFRLNETKSCLGEFEHYNRCIFLWLASSVDCRRGIKSFVLLVGGGNRGVIRTRACLCLNFFHYKPNLSKLPGFSLYHAWHYYKVILSRAPTSIYVNLLSLITTCGFINASAALPNCTHRRKIQKSAHAYTEQK